MTDITSVKIEIVKLKSDNYPKWAWEIEAALRRSGVWRIITGEEVEPPRTLAVTSQDGSTTQSPNPLYTQYLKRVDTASGFILQHLDCWRGCLSTGNTLGNPQTPWRTVVNDLI